MPGIRFLIHYFSKRSRSGWLFRSVVATQQSSAFFQRRHLRNVHNPRQLSKQDFWRQMIVCMCTSVQPSGPNSWVSKLAREKPFPLDLSICESGCKRAAGVPLRFNSKL